MLLFGKIQGSHFGIHVCEVIQVDTISPKVPAPFVCKSKGAQSERRSSRNNPWTSECL